MENSSCASFPLPINSYGVFTEEHILDFSLPRLMLQIILIVFVTQVVQIIARPLGLPKIVPQMTAGIILGRSVLGRIPRFEINVFRVEHLDIITTLSTFAYALFLFLVGVKTDMSVITNSGRKALATGVLALVAPFLVGTLCTFFLNKIWTPEKDFGPSLSYLTVAHSLTPFPVIANLLSDLNMLNSELGRLALSSAIVSDLLSVILVWIGIHLSKVKEVSLKASMGDLMFLACFIVWAVYIFRPAMYRVINNTPKGSSVKRKYTYRIILVVLATGLFSFVFGQSVLFGFYILGLLTPDGPPLGSALVNKLDPFVSAMFLPLFVSVCALTADLSSVNFSSHTTKADTVLIVVTFLVKIAASMLPPLCSKVPFKDALTLGLIMSCKGIVEIATYSFLRDSQNISEESFVLMLVSTLFAASVVPMLVKCLYDPSRKYAGYQKRTIMHLRPESELRVLACIHREDNVAATVNLIDISNAKTVSPVALYVLHLVKLIGRASPLFISHQIQTKDNSNSYSENIIIPFRHYESRNKGATMVQAFTAISPPGSMQEDICTLALNKLASLIILQFHRKWSINGSIEYEDLDLRTLNHSVLDMAPCSVGILVDRAALRRSASSRVSSHSHFSYCVAVFFFGGSDDCEALHYANRISGDPRISLNVVHFINTMDDGVSTWRKMLDSEAMRHIKFNNVDNQRVIFREEMVRNGSETASVIRSIVHEYDLVIVGRRHKIECPQTIGLTEWCEFEELGVIGDLLASSDLNSRCSILVIQQQQQLSLK